MEKHSRYQQMERMMTKALLGDAVAFLVYLVSAAADIGWLTVVAAVVNILISVAGLLFLYLSRELLKQRSLWLSTGFFSIFMCVLASLILAFP